MEAVLATAKGMAGPAPGPLLIENRFRLGPAVSEDLAGLACFEALDNRSGISKLVALRADRETPLRAQLADFIAVEHSALITPVAHGGAGGDYWVVCTAPAGPGFGSLATRWSGNSLLVHVLRPVASALEALAQHGLTHRSIRPDNLFPAADMRGAVLGPAWTGPPASRQACVFEPISSAVCAPEARGEGTIADDVYALGVLLLALWTGELPLAGCSAREILQLKLERGSHAALTEPYRLPRNFDELLRAMLADDGGFRPSPAALVNLDVANTRRGAPRVAPRASRPIQLGARTIWNRRSLAFEAAGLPALALAALRDGSFEFWLRRNTDDAALAAKLEELRHSDHVGSRGDGGDHGIPGDAMTLMRLVALLDPLAPMFFLGMWFWPDGLGPILAGALATGGANPNKASDLLRALLSRNLALEWHSMRPQQPVCTLPTVPPLLLQQRPNDDQRSSVWRAAYWLNPLLPCMSPLPALDRAVSLAGLLLALEKAAVSGGLVPPQARSPDGRKQVAAGNSLLDASMHGFLAARLEAIAPSKETAANVEPDERFRDLAVLARSQRAASAGALPNLASVLLAAVEPLLLDWPGRTFRAERQERLRAASIQGDLRRMLALIDDPGRRHQDEAAREQAAALLVETREQIATRGAGLAARLDVARAVARDTAAAAGLCCVTASLLYELLR